jgi:hypothetical protein
MINKGRSEKEVGGGRREGKPGNSFRLRTKAGLSTTSAPYLVIFLPSPSFNRGETLPMLYKCECGLVQLLRESL